jgi:hypothetical protein
MKKITILPGVNVYISNEMIDMLGLIESNKEIKFDSLELPQKKLLKELHERNLLVRRRKNNEVSYSIRSGINWR